MLMQVVFLRDEGFVVASKVRTYWYSFPAADAPYRD
jgi:hypothetical protein